MSRGKASSASCSKTTERRSKEKKREEENELSLLQRVVDSPFCGTELQPPQSEETPSGWEKEKCNEEKVIKNSPSGSLGLRWLNQLPYLRFPSILVSYKDDLHYPNPFCTRPLIPFSFFFHKCSPDEDNSNAL